MTDQPDETSTSSPAPKKSLRSLIKKEPMEISSLGNVLVDRLTLGVMRKLVAIPLNLDPKGDHLERYLKSIIDGLQRQIGGLYEVANKASDRPHGAITPPSITRSLRLILLSRCASSSSNHTSTNKGVGK